MYILTFLALIIPYSLIWFVLYRSIKNDIKSALNYSLLTLLTLISLMCYGGLCVWLGANFHGEIGTMILASSYLVAIYSCVAIIPTLILTLILYGLYLVKNHKKKAHT